MKISKVIYYSTLVVGGGLILFDKLALGFGTMIVGGIIAVVTDPEAGAYSSYKSSESKPYYKDEFEEYQHFKIVNKEIYGEQVRRRLEGEEGYSTPDRDCGLLNHEKAQVEVETIIRKKRLDGEL